MRRFLLVSLALCVLAAFISVAVLAAAPTRTPLLSRPASAKPVVVTPTPFAVDPAETSVPSGPTAFGFKGAVSTVDPHATGVGLEVLRRGGNAVDAAVAAAATVGLTDPFSAGIGGGGFFVYYDAHTGIVSTIDGREAAPAAMAPRSFVNSSTGQPYPFTEARVSGLSVGVPGTMASWDEALRRWGTWSLAATLAPASDVSRNGFVVDQTFHSQVRQNAALFSQFSSTSALFLPGGQPPAVGSTFRNPDLAATYDLVAREGLGAFYGGPIGHDVVATVQRPPRATRAAQAWPHPIRPGGMTLADLTAYRAPVRPPTHLTYRGHDVYGMAPPASGGVTVGLALNILEGSDLAKLDRTQALHRYLEASALAFADRDRYLGADTPPALVEQLLADDFARQRACHINPARTLSKPVAPGTPGSAGCVATAGNTSVENGRSTTNLTVADRWGNVVVNTFTIEQVGGNGMVVPGRGFLLNNELTDFNLTPTQGSAPDPNLPGPGKRPRSSMSPTIVLTDGKPWLALGSPGGTTIITTVLQVLINRIDFGMTLPEAIAAPRASQRNTASVTAEPAFISAASGLTALGHTFSSSGEIGVVTAVEFLPQGRLLAAAEPVRHGTGSAGVLIR